MWTLSIVGKQIPASSLQAFAVLILPCFLLLLAILGVNSEVLWAREKHREPQNPENQVGAPTLPSFAEPPGDVLECL